MGRRKFTQIAALALAAVLAFPNSSFAYAVGKPGETEKGDELSIVLDAQGGSFTIASSSDATAANADEITPTLDFNAIAKKEDDNGHAYAEFNEFVSCATLSNADEVSRRATPSDATIAASKKIRNEGPMSKPEGRENLKFAGWYEDLSNPLTKIGEDTLIYDSVELSARWVDPDAATVNEALKSMIKNVTVSGLPDQATLDIVPVPEADQKTAEALNEYLATLGYDKAKVTADMIQLDISTEATDYDVVGITMDTPEILKDKDEIVAIHINDADEPELLTVEREKTGGKDTITFATESFSTFVLAGIYSIEDTAEVTVENVPGGYLGVFIDEDMGNGKQKRTFLPIGETVSIPLGTELTVTGYGVSDSKEGWRGALPTNSEGKSFYKVKSAETTKEYDTWDDYKIESGAPIKIAADFEKLEWNTAFIGPYLSINPWIIGKGGTYTGTLSFEIRNEDGSLTRPENYTISFNNDNDNNNNNNELFKLNGNTLTSKSDLVGPALYFMEFDVNYGDKQYTLRESLHVGSSATMYMGLATYNDVNKGFILESYTFEGDITFKELFDNTILDSNTEYALFGYTQTGWINDNGDPANDTDVVRGDNFGTHSFYTISDGYTPAVIKGLTGDAKPDESDDPSNPEKPDDPSDPEKPDDPIDPEKPDDPSDPEKPDDTPGGNDSGGSGGSSSSSSQTSSSNTMYGTWKRDDRGWWYQLTNGNYAKSQWGKISNIWYYFGADGYMLTGWQFINDQWYYLNTEEAGMGGMKTGWFYDTGYQRWFYLNPSGAMLTGWQNVNEVWYYLNDSSNGTRGAMAANTQIGEYYVNSDGARVPK